LKRKRLMVRCTSRKLKRKSPERDMTSFLPTEDLRNEDLLVFIGDAFSRNVYW
jgi:hypothetical protein